MSPLRCAAVDMEQLTKSFKIYNSKFKIDFKKLPGPS